MEGLRGFDRIRRRRLGLALVSFVSTCCIERKEDCRKSQYFVRMSFFEFPSFCFSTKYDNFAQMRRCIQLTNSSLFVLQIVPPAHFGNQDPTSLITNTSHSFNVRRSLAFCRRRPCQYLRSL